MFLSTILLSTILPLSGRIQADPKPMLVLTDFTSSTPDLGWYVVNDNVMGGRSEGGFEIVGANLLFSGRTNTTGGGFSSIRTRKLELDLSQAAGISLHVRGDGRRYTWRLTTDARWRGQEVGYWAEFETLEGEWHSVSVPFSSFIPTFRGSVLNGLPLDPARIEGMGLMIYDGKDGPFELRLDRVETYTASAE